VVHGVSAEGTEDGNPIILHGQPDAMIGQGHGLNMAGP
jgi:hypothetical protein